MTHDSIGLGEDGPTHQPIEHLMSLRAMPNLAVFRPADAVETAECWELALRRSDGPSLLALTRQNLPQLRPGRSENLSARGAYRLRSAAAAGRLVLIATGSEVELAVAVAEALEARGIGADVVSMPCWSLFDAQDQAWRDDVLPPGLPRVSIEAGTTFGWERYVGPDGLSIGLDRFGASAPAEDLFKRFGFSVEAIVPRILAALNLQGDQ
jgi:transketolase